MTEEKPIKLIDDRQFHVDIDDSGDIYSMKISRKLSLFEIAKLFDVSVEDIINGKVGYLIIEDGGNNPCQTT